MLAGEYYDASAPEIQADLAANDRWLARYNATQAMDPAARRKLLEPTATPLGAAPIPS
ncbi:maltose acetyltransferase domain-containing protein [Belnapia moabensis]|uniref:maltose acetyltransferase domain-containing protein n=1 Tax=Belnapia moabensis TaxID=365533 RepID=UPI00247FDE50|nr:maltose acetyltransferase domain-containing protein [Belnapia moabensis]